MINNNENKVTDDHMDDNAQTSLGWRSTRTRNKVDRLSYAVEMHENSKNEVVDTEKVANIFEKTYNDDENTSKIAMQTVSQQDTMYYHQAIQQTDWEKSERKWIMRYKCT